MPAIANSAAASDHTEATDQARPAGSSSTILWAAVAVAIGAMAAIMFASHRPGHWWGDDWALYINQADSLLTGRTAEVTDGNRFTVDSSLGPAFSPPLYPWGFPMILAPFVAVVGTDVDRLAAAPVVCAAVFSLAWFLLARRRIGPGPALVGTVAVSLTPLLLGWSELIQSEWPFLAVTGIALVAIDRMAASGAFVDLRRSLWPIAFVGLGATAAFSVRREGLAITAAIAAAQLAALIAADRSWWSDRSERVTMAVRLLLPHATALGSVLLLQVVLPSTLVPQYSGTGIGNVWKFRRDHIEHLAEVSGFKRAWSDTPEVFGNATLGWLAVATYLGLAVAGMVLAIVTYRRRDLHLVAYAIGALLIGGSFRSPINRYVVSVAPLLLLFAISTVAVLVRRTRWPAAPAVVTTVLLGAIVWGNLSYAVDRMDAAGQFSDAGSVEWGPTHPAAVEMFDQVVVSTDAADVVAAPKARAMTLITGRPAIQVDDARPIPDTLSLGLVVVTRNSRIHEELRADTAGYRETWGNSRFVLYEPIN